MAILVFGSINMDLVTRVPHLPAPGETLLGHSFETVPGGKGANQAVAAARLGMPVQMVGRLGQDGFGAQLLAGLRADGVGCEGIVLSQGVSSGVAAIAVSDNSENHIIVIPGANGLVDETDITRLETLVPQAKILLLQLEVPLPTVVQAATVAKRAGLTVILDPAPARSDLPAHLYPKIDILTPNQLEAGQLVGFPVQDFETAERAAIALQSRGTATVIIKLGRQGALYKTTNETFTIPPFPVRAVDTVAAGDAFNGGLAAGLAQGLSVRAATTQAAAVAALSVTKPGAQPSLPTQTELTEFLTQDFAHASARI